MPDPIAPGGCAPPVYADDCPACTDQPKGPSGYCEWHEWADKMHRTHSQHRCPKCLRFTVWVPKTPTPMPNPSTAQMYRADKLAHGNVRLANALARAGFDLDDDAQHLPALLHVWAKWCPHEIRRHRDGSAYTLHIPMRWGETVSRGAMDNWGYPFPHFYLIEGHARACIEAQGYNAQTTFWQATEHEPAHYEVSAWEWDEALGQVGFVQIEAPHLAAALVTLRLLVHTQGPNPDA